MAAPLPANVHVSTHPCLLAKLSQFRSKHASARETKTLVNDIATILGVEALAQCLTSVSAGTVSVPSPTTSSPTPSLCAHHPKSPVSCAC